MSDDKTLSSLQELLDIMATLRSTQGCSWDRQQTTESLKPYILEECYELLEAIDRAHPQEICDELGDLLLQVVFQAQIFSEQGEFTIADVAAGISRKLVRRHPHIFAKASADGHEQRWENIKLVERQERGQPLGLAERISGTLPALKRAQKIVKASYPIISEMEHELNRLKLLTDSPHDSTEIRSEIIGSLLFNMVQLSASLGIDAEDELRQTNRKIIAKIDANK